MILKFHISHNINYMDPSYKTTYSNRKLNPHNLQLKIANQFGNYPLDKYYTFD